MSLKRGSVLSVFLCSLVLVGSVEAQSQGVPGRLAALEAQLEQALATIARLQASMAGEAKSRQALNAALETSIQGLKGGGVTQAALDTSNRRGSRRAIGCRCGSRGADRR